MIAIKLLKLEYDTCTLSIDSDKACALNLEGDMILLFLFVQLDWTGEENIFHKMWRSSRCCHEFVRVKVER